MGTKFTTIRITEDKLNKLKMLADWQLRQMGYDPASINEACREIDDRNSLKWEHPMVYA